MKEIDRLERNRIIKANLLLPEQIIRKYLLPTQYGKEFKVKPYRPHGYCKNCEFFNKNSKTRLKLNNFFTRISTPNLYICNHETGHLAPNHRIQRSVRKFHKVENRFFDTHCPLCGEDNIRVKYFGERHACLHCRRSLCNNKGQPVKLFLDSKRDLHCFIRRNDNYNFNVDIDNLYIKGNHCQASFARPSEMIVMVNNLKNSTKKQIRPQTAFGKKRINLRDIL